MGFGFSIVGFIGGLDAVKGAEVHAVKLFNSKV